MKKAVYGLSRLRVESLICKTYKSTTNESKNYRTIFSYYGCAIVLRTAAANGNN
jgi:hypothetical protein